MADKPTEAPAEQQETPTEPDAPDTGIREEIDYQKRYDDLRSEFDRRNQEWSGYEQNPEQFLAKHGYELADPDEEEPDEYETPLDPYEELQQRVERMEAERAEEMTAARHEALQEAEIDHINAQFEHVLSPDREYTDEEIEAIGDLSRVRRTEDGRPDVKGAHDLLYEKVLNTEKERWVTSKKAPSVKPGTQGGESLDLDDPKQRHDYYAKRLGEIDAEQ